MTAREIIVQLAIWPNVILWGSIGLALLIASITSPVLPDEKLHEQAPEAEQESAAPRHRA